MFGNPVKDWFYFTRQQRYGIILLLFLMLAIPSAGRLIEGRSRHRGIDQEKAQQAIQQFEKHLARLEKEKERLASTQRTPESTQSRSLFTERDAFDLQTFDPNKLSIEEWTSMGVSLRVARSIRNYLAAGGRFRFKQDLQRMHLIDDALYAELKPWISLPDRDMETNLARQKDHAANIRQEQTEKYYPKDREPLQQDGGKAPGERTIVHLNKADTTDLQTLRGIGPVFSRRIVRYRELLGGYYCTYQLLEVFGMDSTRLTGIKDHVKTDLSSIRKININEASYRDLVRHPYINQNVASSILSLRDQHGDFSCASDIKRSYLVDEKLWGRLQPYLYTRRNEEEP